MKVQEIPQTKQEIGICPYDSSHTFASHKYVYHIHRCKIGKKNGHLFQICKFNPLHIIPKDEIFQHELECISATSLDLHIRNIDDITQTMRLTNINEILDNQIKEQETQQQLKDEVKIEGEDMNQQGESNRMRIYGNINSMQLQGWDQSQQDEMQQQRINNQQQIEETTLKQTTQIDNKITHSHNPFRRPLQKCKQCTSLLQKYLLLEKRDMLIKDLLTEYCLIT